MIASSARTVAAGLALVVLAAQPAAAQFVRTDAGFSGTVTPRNDDVYVSNAAIGFTVRVGTGTTGLLGFSNNGYANLSTAGGALNLYTFLADLDTRNPATSPVTYGTSVVGGRSAFAVNWLNVGYFFNGGPAVNAQLVLIDRSDIALGDFDFEYNYGDMSQAWYGEVMAFGDTRNWSAPENGGPMSALSNRRYAFAVRSGVHSDGVNVTAASTVPEPGTWALLGTGLLAVGGMRLRRSRAS
jgi:hypothetical protein